MYKFTNQTTEVNNVDIDLRKEAEGLTKEFSINILYIRNCKFVKCKCFDDTNKCGDPNCKLCFGSGYFASMEKIPAIESSSRNTNASSSGYGGLRQTDIGVTNQTAEVYYIQQQYTPKSRDILLKVTWDKQGNPVDIVKVLEITDVYEMRGDNGRIELNSCSISERTDLVRSFNTILKSLPRKAVNQLSKGGKCIWPSKTFKN